MGEPGVFTRRKMFADVAKTGGHIEDAVVRHNPSATFSSRGCPVCCYFCIVPAMEGRNFTLIDDFQPRPILCGNNLSALPEHWQEEVVQRYEKSGAPLLDANSGFEPKTFDEAVLHRWRRINRGPWRFAYDETSEGTDVERVCKMLSEYPARRKRVYVLIGNEPFEACMDRIQQVIAWGAEPHCQPIIKLNARAKEPWVRFDWTPELLRNVARWANRYIWRKTPFSEYRPGYKSDLRDHNSAQSPLELPLNC